MHGDCTTKATKGNPNIEMVCQWKFWSSTGVTKSSGKVLGSQSCMFIGEPASGIHEHLHNFPFSAGKTESLGKMQTEFQIKPELLLFPTKK